MTNFKIFEDNQESILRKSVVRIFKFCKHAPYIFLTDKLHECLVGHAKCKDT